MPKYNVYDYSNQIMGEVEAGGVVEAWDAARLIYSNILDVRQQELDLEVYIKARKCPDCGGHLWFRYQGKEGWYYQCDRCRQWFIRERLKRYPISEAEYEEEG